MDHHGHRRHLSRGGIIRIFCIYVDHYVHKHAQRSRRMVLSTHLAASWGVGSAAVGVATEDCIQLRTELSWPARGSSFRLVIGPRGCTGVSWLPNMMLGKRVSLEGEEELAIRSGKCRSSWPVPAPSVVSTIFLKGVDGSAILFRFCREGESCQLREGLRANCHASCLTRLFVGIIASRRLSTQQPPSPPPPLVPTTRPHS